MVSAGCLIDPLGISLCLIKCKPLCVDRLQCIVSACSAFISRKSAWFWSWMTSSVRIQSDRTRSLNVSFSCWVKWAGFDRCLIPSAFEWWICNAKWKAESGNYGSKVSGLTQTQFTCDLKWSTGSVSLSCTIRAMQIMVKTVLLNVPVFCLFVFWIPDLRHDVYCFFVLFVFLLIS